MIKIYPKIVNIFSKSNAKKPMPNEYQRQLQELEVFHNHIYEYKKGVRPLILMTEKDTYQKTIEERLKKENIDYVIKPVTTHKINVFFGAKQCIDVVKTFNERLDKLTPEQDFMLGIMLGYEKVAQCARYIEKLLKKDGGANNLIG